MKKLFTLLFLMFFYSIAVAKTSIVFINGITTSPDRAVLSTAILQYRYCVYAKKNCSDIEFKNFYNSTEGFFDDNGELDVQAQIEQLAIAKANAMTALALKMNYTPDPKSYTKGSDAYNIFYAYLNTYMTEIYLDKKTKSEGIVYDKNFLGTDKSNANEDITRNLYLLVVKTLKELEKDDVTRKVVLVPHSQGNYFAQAIYAIIKDTAPDLAENLRVQGVASVSTIALMNGQHTSLTQDRALFGHEVSHDYNVNGNFQGGWGLGNSPDEDDLLQENEDDLTNHGFIETYLGGRVISLPSASGDCMSVVVPSEILVETRESARLKYHMTCQDKDSIQNRKILIGAGNKFPSLRGVFLARYIADRISDSINGECNSPKIQLDGVCRTPSLFDDFNGNTLDSSKWSALPIGYQPGNIASFSVSGGSLHISTNGGSNGYMGIADGGRIRPKGLVLDGDFTVVADISEKMRGSNGYGNRSCAMLWMHDAAADVNSTSSQKALISICGDTTNGGLPDRSIVGWAGNSWNFQTQLITGKYYQLEMRIRRSLGKVYLGYRMAGDSNWEEGALPGAPVAGSLVPEILIWSGDGGGTRVNGSFAADINSVVITSP